MKTPVVLRLACTLYLLGALPASDVRAGRPLHYTDGPNPPRPPRLFLPPDSQFDNVRIVRGTRDDEEQTALGTPGKDKLLLYGGKGNVTQYAEGNAGDDWILEKGARLESDQTAMCGDGNDQVYQFGGNGNSTQFIGGVGSGRKSLIQVGGKGNGVMYTEGGVGENSIELFGGLGENMMQVTGGEGEDRIAMYGGPDDDRMTYNVTSGGDTVTINGGLGVDILTINKNHKNFSLEDIGGRVLFSTGPGGTTITVSNIQQVEVIGDDGGAVIYRGR